MAQYDFSPRDRTGGITYQDRVGANPSILTQIAQAGVPVLDALKRRKEQIAREQAIAAVSKELQAGGDVTSPQALELGMRSGLFDAKGVMEMRANAGLKKAQADLASQKAEQIKKALAAGGILWWDENNVPHVIPVDPKYAGTRAFGEREPDKPSNVDPMKKAISESPVFRGALGYKDASPTPLGASPQFDVGTSGGSRTVTGIGTQTGPDSLSNFVPPQSNEWRLVIRKSDGKAVYVKVVGKDAGREMPAVRKAR